MKKLSTVILGVFTFWPFLYIVFYFIYTITFIAQQPLNQPDSNSYVFFHILFFITLAVMYIVLIYYIVFLFRTDRVKGDRRALWAVVIFFGNIIAMPIFWYLYFFKYTFYNSNNALIEKNI